ncbi:B3 domain-containing protein Os04g0386900-like isoform X3 [Asparagus officinalis]|nr:B3 domain-containing protein Os04g0386900-like isoform X3 [Asparagus officinalis]XP_020244827.1 B3 domain-containing protein Os04g0386900-like isoform X3 [Asparagus officinalis]
MNHSAFHKCTCHREGKDSCKKRASCEESTYLLGSKSSAMITSKPGSSTEEEEVRPLSGNPFFTCIFLKAHVDSPYQLTLPVSFHPVLPSADVSVILSIKKKTWEVRYFGGHLKRFCGIGWKRFTVDNKLKIGDGCVFELMDSKNLRFEVRILNGQVPDMFSHNRVRSNEPIVIDD